jgi:hypothetical protein
VQQEQQDQEGDQTQDDLTGMRQDRVRLLGGEYRHLRLQHNVSLRNERLTQAAEAMK